MTLETLRKIERNPENLGTVHDREVVVLSATSSAPKGGCGFESLDGVTQRNTKVGRWRMYIRVSSITSLPGSVSGILG